MNILEDPFRAVVLGLLVFAMGCAGSAPVEPVVTNPFGVDYAHPAKYLVQGEQTSLSNSVALATLRGNEQSIAHLGRIYHWMRKGFTAGSGGGKTIGVIAVDQLLAERRLSGCHDWGLVYASILRELGYPAVVVDALSINWGKQFQAGRRGPFIGHVFVEVFIAGQWILVDPTNNWYAEDNYDPSNPVIPLKGNISGPGEEAAGFYVMRKGLDTRDYGIRNNRDLHRLMEDTARALLMDTLKYPAYKFRRFEVP